MGLSIFACLYRRGYDRFPEIRIVLRVRILREQQREPLGMEKIAVDKRLAVVVAQLPCSHPICVHNVADRNPDKATPTAVTPPVAILPLVAARPTATVPPEASTSRDTDAATRLA